MIAESETGCAFHGAAKVWTFSPLSDMYHQLYDIPHSRFAINAIDFSKDGCVLASGDDAGYIRFFDFPLGKESSRHHRLKVTTAVTSLLWHPNKDAIFIGGARGNVTVMNFDVKVSAISMIPLGSHLTSISSIRLKVVPFALGLMHQ